MLLRSFTGCCLAAALLGAPAAQAGLISAPMPAFEIRLAAMGCGAGSSRDASGACVGFFDRSRTCPPGFFAVSAPTGNGYRCVPNDWLDSHGWLGDFLGFR